MSADPCFLEQAYDGQSARVEVLEARLRECHRLVRRVALLGLSDNPVVAQVAFDAKSLLRRMPEDPTVTE